MKTKLSNKWILLISFTFVLTACSKTSSSFDDSNKRETRSVQNDTNSVYKE